MTRSVYAQRWARTGQTRTPPGQLGPVASELSEDDNGDEQDRHRRTGSLLSAIGYGGSWAAG
jgi:hypothetical protein